MLRLEQARGLRAAASSERIFDSVQCNGIIGHFLLSQGTESSCCTLFRLDAVVDFSWMLLVGWSVERSVHIYISFSPHMYKCNTNNQVQANMCTCQLYKLKRLIQHCIFSALHLEENHTRNKILILHNNFLFLCKAKTNFLSRIIIFLSERPKDIFFTEKIILNFF